MHTSQRCCEQSKPANRRHYVNGVDDIAKNNTYHNNNDDESGNDVVVIMVGCWTKGNPKNLWSSKKVYNLHGDISELILVKVWHGQFVAFIVI